MSIKSIMSTPVVTVKRDDNLGVVREIFINTKFHHLLVVENNKLYGVISDRDLLKVRPVKTLNIATSSISYWF